MAYRLIFSALAAAMMAAAGCRTNKEILDDYEKAIAVGNYSGPIAEIEEKAESGGVDELMWRLHAGSSRYFTGDRADAIAQFDLAEDVFLRNDATSVFRQGTDVAFAMISNDRVFPYSGGGEDRIFACFYKAVDYASEGRRDAALVELNRAAQHQDNWLWERRKEISDAAEQMGRDAESYADSNRDANYGDGQAKARESVDSAFADANFSGMVKAKCDFDMAADGNVETLARKDWLNRYVQYATGVFRWLGGQDDGVNYLREIAAIDGSNGLVKADLADMSRGAAPSDQVWVFVEDGLCPVREEWRLDLPTFLIPYANRYVLYAGMALPYLRYRGAACASYDVSADGRRVPLVEVQDFDSLLKTEFDVYFRGALVREITRTVVKVGMQAALGAVAENTDDHHTRIAMKASQLVAAGWAASVTQADLRSWTALPKKAYAVRVARPASGRISIAGDGAPVAEVELPPGSSMVFVRKPAPGAAAVVKAVAFK